MVNLKWMRRGEGLVDAPKGRSANYTMEEDVLLSRS
jgi:hypothetical protein